VAALLSRVRESALGAFVHQDLTFDRVTEALGRTDLARVMLVLQEAPPPRLTLPGVTSEMREIATGAAKLDLTLLLAAEEGGDLVGGIEYDRDRFAASTIERWAEQWTVLLAAMPEISATSDEPERPLAFVPLLSGSERQQLRVLPAEIADLEGGVAPRTPSEELVAGIWCEVLRRESVGVFESFLDLGGHSLLAAQVASRLGRAVGREMSLREVLAAPTVAGLAAWVDRALRAGIAEWDEVPALVRVSREEALPASFGQGRLWLLGQLDPESPAYHLPAAVRLGGRLDVSALERSLGALVARHEALRTTFAAGEDGLVQRIQPVAPWRNGRLGRVDLQGMPAARRESAARDLAAAEARRPFDLASDLPLRAVLLVLGADDHRLLLTLHHIAADGWSLPVLTRELSALYATEDLSELPVQYADFAVWQRRWMRGEPLTRRLGYWRERLTRLPRLELPADRPHPVGKRQRGAYRPLTLEAERVARLRALGRRSGATLFMVLLAGLEALLGRLSGQEDLAVATPVAGRTHGELEPLIGFFVNTLVLRGDLSGEPTVSALLSRVRETALGAFAYQDLPFDLVTEMLGRTDLARVMLVLQEAPPLRLDLPGLATEVREIATGAAKLDLTFQLAARDGGLVGGIEYDCDRFAASTIERWAGHWTALLAAMAEEPERSVASLDLLSGAERQQLVVEWNDTGETGEPELLHEGFLRQAGKQPEAVALVCGDRSVRYGELAARVARLAVHLRELGVGPETTVGVCLERSIEMVEAMLGVLAAGGAYVPLDPGYPAERLAFLAVDAGLTAVVTREALRSLLPSGSFAVVCLDGEAPLLASPLTQPPPSQGGGTRPPRLLPAAMVPENLAYLIYTSGSTGRPKGVAIEHRSACALVRWSASVFPDEALDGVLASTSINFDLSVFEIFVPLSRGGRVVLVENALALPALPPLLPENGVRLLNTVPSALAELLRQGPLPPSVKTVNLAGEPLRRSLVEQAYSGGAERVYNLYGPSEDTTYSTWEQVAAGDPSAPSIGRPIGGTRAYLVDGRLELVPPG
ncbi:MAG TPA: condensation domain-containing protein, partial [Thermoanaerobaculia bacterium]|nr:condensation domain-containing protein [Thermoanaerobaculia bacterium]